MSEENEIKRDGAKGQSNSGRGWKEKGDARLEPFLVDYKEYGTSFSISLSSWRKICSDAVRARLLPSLKLVLGTGNNKIRLWVIEDRMFHEMREAWLEKYGE